MTEHEEVPPILMDKHYASPSAFTPESLLREARRQKGAAADPVPDVCLLDPDGDIVRQLKADGRAERHDGWVCYHTDLFVFEENGLTIGVVGCTVGASFAVLVAEELFASGCKLLISITSSGQLTPVRPTVPRHSRPQPNTSAMSSVRRSSSTRRAPRSQTPRAKRLKPH